MKRPAAGSSISKKPAADNKHSLQHHPDGRIKVYKCFYSRTGVYGLKMGGHECLRVPRLYLKHV